MPRYIDAEKIEYREGTSVYDGYDSEGSEYYRREQIAYKSEIDEIPTADVVPKSEVAREIFEEIENALNLSKCYGDSGIYFEHDIETDIAELKKKYTEDA